MKTSVKAEAFSVRRACAKVFLGNRELGARKLIRKGCKAFAKLLNNIHY